MDPILFGQIVVLLASVIGSITTIIKIRVANNHALNMFELQSKLDKLDRDSALAKTHDSLKKQTIEINKSIEIAAELTAGKANVAAEKADAAYSEANDINKKIKDFKDEIKELHEQFLEQSKIINKFVETIVKNNENTNNRR